MADSKQAGHLNGAYYGPAIPPQQQQQQRGYRSIGRRGSGCGPCCLLCNLFKFIISIVITVGIIVLVLWLVFRPHNMNVHATDATLSKFDLNNGTLNYDLSVVMDVRNPNKRIAIYYDYVEARAYYDDERFSFSVLPTFYQGHKNTTTLRPAFQGSQLALGSVSTTYSREKGEGYYYVDVKLYTKVRVKVWFLKIHYKGQKVKCALKLPVPGSSGQFEDTKCDVDLF